MSAAIAFVAGVADLLDLETMVREYPDGVVPRFRARLGVGIDARAMAAATREMGAGRLLPDTGVPMTEAQGLYRQLGFREISHCPESEKPPAAEHLLLYVKLPLVRPRLSSASP